MSLNRKTETHDRQCPIGYVTFVVLLPTPVHFTSRNIAKGWEPCAVPSAHSLMKTLQCVFSVEGRLHINSAFIYPAGEVARSSICYATRRHISDSSSYTKGYGKGKAFPTTCHKCTEDIVV